MPNLIHHTHIRTSALHATECFAPYFAQLATGLVLMKIDILVARTNPFASRALIYRTNPAQHHQTATSSRWLTLTKIRLAAASILVSRLQATSAASIWSEASQMRAACLAADHSIGCSSQMAADGLSAALCDTAAATKSAASGVPLSRLSEGFA